MKFAISDKTGFVDKLTELILNNIEDENFGVSELAQLSGMSRYTLNQKLHAAINKSTNQFIREIRLRKAMEMIQNEEVTASEVAYKVGFSSPTYFNKCFHEYFGFPPGQVNKAETGNQVESNLNGVQSALKLRKRKHLITLPGIIVIGVVFLILGYFSYDRFFKSDSTDEMVSEGGRISLAVLPFQNMTNDTLWNIWEQGIQTNLIASLSNSEELKVRQFETVNGIITSKGFVSHASLTPSVASSISRKLDARVFIYGSISQAGNKIRINAQIIDSKTEETLKSFQLDGTPELIMHLIDSLSIRVMNTLLISKLQKIGPQSLHEPYLKNVQSPEAYRYFMMAQTASNKNDFKTAIECYQRALEIDSTIIGALLKISNVYYNSNNFEQGKIWFGKFYSKMDKMDMKQKIWANIFHAVYFETPNERIRYLRQLNELDDQNPVPYFDLGDTYLEIMEYDKAITEFNKALEIFKKWDIKPYWGAYYYELGQAYHKSGRYKEEKKLYRIAEKEFPEEPELIDQCAWLALTENDTVAVNHYIARYISIRKEQGWTEAQIADALGYVYFMAGISEKAEELYREALSVEPENPVRIRRLAYFLIDNNRNVDEGIKLVENILNKEPDNYSCLYIKGMGFYKQGKYQEALDIYQKSWDLRRQNSIYNHLAYIHLEEAKKTVAGIKNK